MEQLFMLVPEMILLGGSSKKDIIYSGAAMMIYTYAGNDAVLYNWRKKFWL